tara:strand:- start:2569 stop:2694 length:126 start_codon:yes stop_codon:yes gene_type:complete
MKKKRKKREQIRDESNPYDEQKKQKKVAHARVVFSSQKIIV